MTAPQHAMAAYGRAAATMPPLQQIVLLYDGAIRRIRDARRAIDERRPNDLWIATSKATAIVEALSASLDHRQGGIISQNLERLYDDLEFRLQRLNLEPDPEICDRLAARLDTLRQAWAELAMRPTEVGADLAHRETA